MSCLDGLFDACGEEWRHSLIGKILLDQNHSPKYEVVREIARGGMGVVYEVADLFANRLPRAIKIVTQLSQPENVGRFREESQVLVLLAGNHGICKIHEVSECHLAPFSGMPFIVMDLEKGVELKFGDQLLHFSTLSEFLAFLKEKKKRLTPRQAAIIIRHCAKAIALAHNLENRTTGERIAHRDLKPQNVLLRKPFEDSELPFETVIIDFGLSAPRKAVDTNSSFAKAPKRDSDENLSTEVRGEAAVEPQSTDNEEFHFEGTYPYAAPEQLNGLASQKADTWALGVMLFEMLVGSLPFKLPDTESVSSLKNSYIEHEPSFEKIHDSELRRICKSCLRIKEELRPSAENLAQQVDNWLKYLPGPQSSIKCKIKFAMRRHPLFTVFLSCVLLFFIAVTGVLLVTNSIVTEQNAKLNQATVLVNESLINQRYGIGTTLLRSQQYEQALPWIAHAISNRPHKDFSVDDARLIIKNVTNGGSKTIDRILEHDDPVSFAEFSPDGKKLVSAAGRYVHIWDRQVWTRLSLEHEETVYSFAFSPDAKNLLTISDSSTIRVWDLETQSIIARWHAERGIPFLAKHLSDSSRFMIGFNDGDKLYHTEIWDWRTNQKRVFPSSVQSNWLFGSVASDDLRWLAIADQNEVNLWRLEGDASVPTQTFTLEGEVTAIDISSDGNWLAVGCKDGTVRQWNIKLGTKLEFGTERLKNPLRHAGPISLLKYSKGGENILVTVGSGEFVYQASTGTVFPYDGINVTLDYFPLGGTSPDKRYIALPDETRLLRIFDRAGTGRRSRLVCFIESVDSISFNSIGSRCAIEQTNRSSSIVNTITGGIQTETGFFGDLIPLDGDCEAIVASGEKVYEFKRSKFHEFFSHDKTICDLDSQAEKVAIADRTRFAKIVDMNSKKVVGTFDHYDEKVLFVKLDRQARVLLTVAIRKDEKTTTARVWNVNDESLISTLTGSLNPEAIYLSADGEKIIAMNSEQELCAYSTRTGQYLFSPNSQDGILDLAVNPECTRIVLLRRINGSPSFTVATACEVADDKLTQLGSDVECFGNVTCVSVSDDGKYFAVGSDDHTSQVWSMNTGAPVTPLLEHDGEVKKVVLSSDGKKLLTVEENKFHQGGGELVRLWEIGISSKWTDEDLLNLSVIQSGKRVTESGYAEVVKDKEYLDAWKSLQVNHVEELSVTQTQLADFHVKELDVSWKLEDYTASLKQIEQILDKSPKPIAPAFESYYLYMQGFSFLRLNELAKAEESVKESIRLGGEDPKSWITLGQIYERNKEWGKVIEVTTKAQTLLPPKKAQADFQDSEIFRLRGRANASLKNWQEAASDFRSYIKNNRKPDLEYERYWAICTLMTGNLSDYEIRRRELLEELYESGDASVLWGLLRFCLLAPYSSPTSQSGEISKKLNIAMQKVASFYSTNHTQWLLGAVYLRGGFPERAKGVMELEVSKEDNAASKCREGYALSIALFQCGEVFESKKQFEIAERKFAEIASSDEIQWHDLEETELWAMEARSYFGNDVTHNIPRENDVVSTQALIAEIDKQIETDPADGRLKIERAILRMRVNSLDPRLDLWAGISEEFEMNASDATSPELTYYSALAYVKAGNKTAYQNICRELLCAIDTSAPDLVWTARTISLSESGCSKEVIHKRLIPASKSYGLNGRMASIRLTLLCAKASTTSMRETLLDFADTQITETQAYINQYALKQSPRLRLLQASLASLRGNSEKARNLIADIPQQLSQRLIEDPNLWEEDIEARLMLQELEESFADK